MGLSETSWLLYTSFMNYVLKYETLSIGHYLTLNMCRLNL